MGTYLVSPTMFKNFLLTYIMLHVNEDHTDVNAVLSTGMQSNKLWIIVKVIKE